jgi:hypothetical protein
VTAQATGTLTITNARTSVAEALAPVTDGDPAVLTSLVDSLDPPALMVGWDDPWLEPAGTCRFTGRLVVWCVAARLEPGEGVADLERLVSYAIGRLQADSYSWGLPSVTAPRVFTIGAIDYLAARISFGPPVTTNPED